MKKEIMNASAAIAAVLLCVSGVAAQAVSPYVGEELREIKTLSADDIDQLENGRGWGLAKAAELNGYPGPVHVLELKDRLGLTAEQEKRMTALFNAMKAEAIPAGRELISLERELNLLFSGDSANAEELQKVLAKIGETRARLRFIHLSAHLKTPSILTRDQMKRYNELRGYAGDPCKNVPEGHDPEMWKKHNGCR